MLSDFEIIQHQFTDCGNVTIIPVSDVHFGASEQMEREWVDFLEMVKEHPNVYLTLGGDLLNNGLKNSVTDVYRERYMPGEAKKMMCKMLEPVRDRILCAVGGNHERRSMKDADADITYDIMAKLDIEHLYRENIAFLKIQMGKRTSSNGESRTGGEHRPTYTIVVTHGAGGGFLTGSAVNRNERFGYIIDGMDALIAGHTHKPFTTQPGKIFIDKRNNKVSIKPFYVISSTSWLNYGGYAAQKMLLPTSHCLHMLQLRGDQKEIVVTM